MKKIFIVIGALIALFVIREVYYLTLAGSLYREQNINKAKSEMLAEESAKSIVVTTAVDIPEKLYDASIATPQEIGHTSGTNPLYESMLKLLVDEDRENWYRFDVTYGPKMETYHSLYFTRDGQSTIMKEVNFDGYLTIDTVGNMYFVGIDSTGLDRVFYLEGPTIKRIVSDKKSVQRCHFFGMQEQCLMTARINQN